MLVIHSHTEISTFIYKYIYVFDTVLFNFRLYSSEDSVCLDRIGFENDQSNVANLERELELRRIQVRRFSVRIFHLILFKTK